jgi:hypothetical protein
MNWLVILSLSRRFVPYPGPSENCCNEHFATSLTPVRNERGKIDEKCSDSRPLTLNPSPHRMGRGNLILNTLSSIGWRRETGVWIFCDLDFVAKFVPNSSTRAPGSRAVLRGKPVLT